MTAKLGEGISRGGGPAGGHTEGVDIAGRLSLSLRAAIGSGHTDTALGLLDSGADPRSTNSKGDTPLHLAMRGGVSVSVIHALLAAGADPDFRNERGATPLYPAARRGNAAATRILLDRGADPNVANVGGATPLFVAASRGHFAVVRALLDAGADPRIARTDGRTPLHRCRGAEVATALLAAGADLSATDWEGRSVLDICVQSGLPNRFARQDDWEFLRDHAADGPEWRSLEINLGAIEVLLAAGADPNADAPPTPLHRAARFAQLHTVRALLAAGADPNARDEIGRTPLHHVVDKGRRSWDPRRLPIVEALLAAGADRDIVSGNGFTALQTIVEWPRPEIIAALSLPAPQHDTPKGVSLTRRHDGHGA